MPELVRARVRGWTRNGADLSLPALQKFSQAAGHHSLFERNSSPLLWAGGMFRDPQWMPETGDSTEPEIHYVFSYTNGQVAFFSVDMLDKG